MADQLPLSSTDGLTLLGQSGLGPMKKLEVFPNPSPFLTSISFETEEFTSHCPVTNQPDFGKILIEYHPNEYCLETKSLKLYLMTFRDRKEFWEALAAIILRDLQEVLDPWSITVTVIQNPRGGIGLTVKAEG